MKCFTRMIVQTALTLLLLALPASALLAQGVKPVLVISITNLDELFGDIRAVTEAAGSADAGNMVTGLAGLYTNGIDRTRPIGAYVSLEADQPRVIVFVPVKNLKGTLAMFREQIGEPRDVGDGILQVAADKPQPVYIKEQNGWAFLAQSSSHLGTLPADPVATLNGLDKTYDVAIRVNIDNIPAQYKQLAIQELTKGFEKSLKNVPEEDREVTQKLGSNSMQSIVRAVQESEQLTLGLSIDGKNKKTFLEGSMTAIAGTELAKQMAELKNSTSAHAGFLLPGAAATLSFTNQISMADIPQVLAMLQTVREKAMKEIDNDASLPSPETRTAAKNVASTLIDVIQQTVQNGKVDGGAVLSLEDDELTFAAGGLVADGKKVEESLKKLISLAKERKEIPKAEFNVASHNGVDFHQFTVPLDDADEDAREIFGDELTVVVGTGKESVYVAFGDDPQDLLKKIITKSAKDRNVQVPLGQFNLALGSIMKFAATVQDDPKVKALASAADAAEGRDHLIITARPIDRGAAYRIEIEDGILKIIGATVKAQQQR